MQLILFLKVKLMVIYKCKEWFLNVMLRLRFVICERKLTLSLIAWKDRFVFQR